MEALVFPNIVVALLIIGYGVAIVYGAIQAIREGDRRHIVNVLVFVAVTVVGAGIGIAFAARAEPRYATVGEFFSKSAVLVALAIGGGIGMLAGAAISNPKETLEYLAAELPKLPVRIGRLMLAVFGVLLVLLIVSCLFLLAILLISRIF